MNKDRQIYTTTANTEINGVISQTVLTIPYYYSVINDNYYVAFNEIADGVLAGDRDTTITLSKEQTDAVRDTIVMQLKGDK